MAGRNITNPTTYGTLPASPPPSNTNLFDGSFSPLYGVVTDSGNWTNAAADTGVVNAYSCTLTPAAASYNNGMVVFLNPVNTNTGASTINVNGLGTKSIVNPANIALSGGEIAVNRVCGMEYDGTVFRIFTGCALNKVLGTLGTSTSIECAGYTSIFINVAFNVNNSSVTLTHLAAGTAVTIALQAAGGSTLNLGVNASDPSGTVLTTSCVAGGGIGGFSSLASGISIPSGSGRILTGVAGVTSLQFS